MAMFRIKESNGKSYLVARFTNRWRDYDFHAAPEQGGEIISNNAHKEYASWLDKNPQHAPELWTWHMWGTGRKNRADWWDYTGDFFHMQWELSPDEAKALNEMVKTGYIPEMPWRKVAKGEEWGLSFGFYALKYDYKDAVIDKYRAFEVSVLPLKSAANPWTAFELIGVPQDAEAKEKGMFTKQKRAQLVAKHGEEFVRALEVEDEVDAKLLEEAKVETKSKKAKAAASDAKQEDPAEDGSNVPASEKAVVEALERLKAIQDGEIAKLKERIEQLEGFINGLKERIEEEEKREEEEAKAAAMPASVLASWLSNKTVADGSKNAATINKKSAISKKGPSDAEHKSPKQKRREEHGLAYLFKTIDQGVKQEGLEPEVEDDFELGEELDLEEELDFDEEE